MAKSQKIDQFLASREAVEIRHELSKMMEDPQYNTKSSYSPASKEMVTFVDKHMKYLSLHLHVSSAQYLSNLKLITKYN